MPSIAKELMMNEIKGVFEENPYAFISNFEEFTVEDMGNLRRSLEASTNRSIVLKHSFAKKIFSEKSFDEASGFLKSSVLVTFADKNPQDASKALVEFAKTNQKFTPAGVIFEDKVFNEDYVKALAELPSRHELLTQLAVRVKSPISGLASTLGQVVRGVVVALNQIKEKKAAAAAS